MRKNEKGDDKMNLELWDWCYHCNRKHYRWNVISPSPRCRREPLTRHSESHHFYKHIRSEDGGKSDYAEESGELVRLGLPVYSIKQCVVCGKMDKEKVAWKSDRVIGSLPLKEVRKNE